MSTLDIERLVRDTFLADVEHFEEVDSTNNVARIRGEQADTALPRLIVADRQTAGRGRGSNRWWTGSGAVACSLLIDPRDLIDPHRPIAISDAELRRRTPLAALAAGLATVEAASVELADQTVGLHWPNDVYVGTRKLAGVLVESIRPDRLVVGIGINTHNSSASAPEELRGRVVAICDLIDRPVDHTGLLIRLVRRLEHWMLRMIDAPQAIGREANARLSQRGELLTVESGGETIAGRCLGIADDGALVLETPGGQRGVYSGTIRS